MIRVCKPSAPPRLARGQDRTRKDCDAYNANRVEYENGTRKFVFDQSIYGHHSVREVLRQAQNRKCCFCEGKFDAFASGDVEHYRPKGAVRQDESAAVLKPGYFWLAYTWENLYWCCQTCNRSHKRDLFPLQDRAKRARSDTDCLADELPHILDPGGPEDPVEHIGFHYELAVPLTDRGKTTIELLGLNRPALIEERRDRLSWLDGFLAIVRVAAQDPVSPLAASAGRASRVLDAAVSAEARFSAMATKFVTNAT